MKFSIVLRDYSKVGELTKKYSNLPDSYIKRSMEQIIYKTPRLPNYLPKEFGRKKIQFTMNRPWTMQSRLENPLFGRSKKIFLEPVKDWVVFKGDRVEVLVGDDKGKHGNVCQIIQERNWVLVEGLNCKLKVVRKENGVPSVVVQEELPLRVTDQVALVDPSDMLPCKVEWRYTEKGERVRVSLRTGRIIPMSKMAEETYDYKTTSAYKESLKDTVQKEATKITYAPTLSTFEMDILRVMGINEDRIPAKTYWY